METPSAAIYFILASAFFFAFFSSFRFLVNLPLLDRPLTLGFFWGLFTGDWASSLGICLFFELLWLDIFPAGTIIPPQSLAPALASLSLTHRLAVDSPALAAVVILMTLPLGRLFAQLERYHRRTQDGSFERLLQWSQSPGSSPGPALLTLRSVLFMIPLNAVAFALSLAVLLGVLAFLLPSLGPALERLPVAWPHLWVIASIGAVLSLRHRPAYALLLGGVVLAVGSRLLF